MRAIRRTRTKLAQRSARFNLTVVSGDMQRRRLRHEYVVYAGAPTHKQSNCVTATMPRGVVQRNHPIVRHRVNKRAGVEKDFAYFHKSIFGSLMESCFSGGVMSLQSGAMLDQELRKVRPIDACGMM